MISLMNCYRDSEMLTNFNDQLISEFCNTRYTLEKQYGYELQGERRVAALLGIHGERCETLIV